MTYFPRKMDSIERGGKVAADIFCVFVLGGLAVGCIGPLYGIVATVLVVVGLLIIDYLVPDAEESATGVIR
jgi:hypothetical protein